MLEEMQQVSFQIIAAVGSAKSSYIEGMRLAREGQFEEANAKLVEGDEIFSQGHAAHFELVQKEASGEQLPFSIMFIHAEDQMLTTESIRLMAEEIIILHETIQNK